VAGPEPVGWDCSPTCGQAMSRPSSGTAPAEPPARYEIRVKGVLESRWSAWFEGLQISSEESDVTVIAGPVTDQAALHGLLAKIRDLGLPLLSVQRISPGPAPEEEQ
jgi:hypothetical protein